MHLDRPNVHKADLELMLHELQHTLQYDHGGGLWPVFTKVVLQHGEESLAQLPKLFNGGNMNSIHDDAPLEVEADRVAFENLDRVYNAMVVYKEIPPPLQATSGGVRRGPREILRENKL